MTRSNDAAPVFEARAIGKIHGFLGPALSKVLGLEVRLVPTISGEWKRVAPGTIVRWVLASREYQEYSDAQSRGELVLPLPDPKNEISVESNHAWWVGWAEEWQKLRDKHFAFRTAGWHVYCGPAGFQRDKHLILRAEWGPVSANGVVQRSNAGQPHWHSQMRHIIGAGIASDASQTDPDAVPINASSDDPEVGGEVLRVGDGISDHARSPNVDFSGLHLAMAGWKNAQTAPERWQHVVNAEFSTALREWSIATLEYLQSQMGEMKVR